MNNDLPQNPAGYFVNGSDEKYFTYEPGKKMFYVKVHTSGYIMLSMLLFADDLIHLKKIFKAACDHRVACAKKYQAYSEKRNRRSGTEELQAHGAKKWLDALRAVDLWPEPEGRVMVEIVEAPRNQLYKVSWAGNDEL